MWASHWLLPCLINDLAKSLMGHAIQKASLAVVWLRNCLYPLQRAAGQLVVHPLLAETCIQRKTMYLSAALIGNEFRVHLTLLRKHFTVRVSGFMLIPPWMIANTMLKSKTSESELVKKKKRVFNLNDYKPQSSLWMILKPRIMFQFPHFHTWELLLTLWIMWKLF